MFKRQTSAFIIILGRRGTGKTDFALLIAEILHARKIIDHVATNIKIYDSPFPIEKVTNLDDLREWASKTSGTKLFIFDEIGKGMRRRTPMSSLNVHLIDEFHILRKFRLSILATTINKTYVDNAVLGSDVLDGYFEKTNYRNPKIAHYLDYLEYFSEQLTDIPVTSVKFDTWDSAPFKEHGEKRKPKFKEDHLNTLWEWSHGKTAKELNLHRMEINRLVRKYVRETMEQESQVT